MVLNFRSRDEQFRGILLGCFAVVVDLELLAGPELARLLCHEITRPAQCTVLYWKEVLMQDLEWMLLDFFFFLANGSKDLFHQCLAHSILL